MAATKSENTANAASVLADQIVRKLRPELKGAERVEVFTNLYSLLMRFHRSVSEEVRGKLEEEKKQKPRKRKGE